MREALGSKGRTNTEDGGRAHRAARRPRPLKLGAHDTMTAELPVVGV